MKFIQLPKLHQLLNSRIYERIWQVTKSSVLTGSEVYKEGNPARPVVSMINTPEYELAKFFNLSNHMSQICRWFNQQMIF